MTDKTLRYIVDLVRGAGATKITTETGGKHRKLVFTNPAGVEHRLAIHRGTSPKRFEDSLRSQLRRRGLTL